MCDISSDIIFHCRVGEIAEEAEQNAQNTAPKFEKMSSVETKSECDTTSLDTKTGTLITCRPLRNNRTYPEGKYIVKTAYLVQLILPL
jgi:hypothetical protein